jgi:multicomponent Na+:H+ antiporter subunit D
MALLVSLMTLLSMARLWDQAFWRPAPGTPVNVPLGTRILAPIAALSVAIVALSLAAGPVFALTLRAAGQLLQPGEYISAVLGGK